VPTLKKMWKHASIVQKCCAGTTILLSLLSFLMSIGQRCIHFAAGIILVELSFFVSPGTKFVTKRDIAWLLSLVNSDDIDEGVLLGVLKLIGGLCETNYGKARYCPWCLPSWGLHWLIGSVCDRAGNGFAPWTASLRCSS
jgi:hypothetical protein